jgi:hypothetical protein
MAEAFSFFEQLSVVGFPSIEKSHLFFYFHLPLCVIASCLLLKFSAFIEKFSEGISIPAYFFLSPYKFGMKHLHSGQLVKPLAVLLV